MVETIGDVCLDVLLLLIELTAILVHCVAVWRNISLCAAEITRFISYKMHRMFMYMKFVSVLQFRIVRNSLLFGSIFRCVIMFCLWRDYNYMEDTC